MHDGKLKVVGCYRSQIGEGLTLSEALLNAIVLPASFAIGCTLGSLRGVGIAWSVVFPLTCALLVLRVTRLVGVSFRDYCATLVPPALVAIFCLVGMLPVSWLLPSGLLRLCVRSAAGLVCFAAALLFQPSIRELVRQLLGVEAVCKTREFT